MTFETVYENNKSKWARNDCQTARYAYRQLYNMPRISIDRIDEMTEYEFDYELLLKSEYLNFLEHMNDNDTADTEYDIANLRGGVSKSMQTDPDLYDEIKRRIEAGEPIEFGPLPEDGIKWSEKLAGVKISVPVDPSEISEAVTAEDADFESVDLTSIFGGVGDGGS